MIRLALGALAIGLLSGCATLPSPDLRERAALDKALEGRVAGEPRTCLSTIDTANSTTYDATILYGRGRTIYRQDLGGCPELRWNVFPVFQVRGGQVCQGDIVQFADRGTNSLTGSCVVGPFVPYTRP